MAEAPREREDDYGPPIWAPFERLEAVLRRWQSENADIMRLEIAGRSRQGRPVYAVRLTDPTVADDTKEHALLTGLHSGVERTGTATMFYLMEWLLSGDPASSEILRRQVVVVMPVPTPDDYVEGKHGAVYGPWTLDGPPDPEALPEAAVVQRVMDRLQPEVHADIHGVSMDFARYIMLENSGSSYSNLGLRCYHREIIRQMDEAALSEGYPSDLQEADSERIFWGPELDAMGSRLWSGRPRVYAATYCYHHYHTILSASEVGWERSGYLRHRRLLEIGDEVWPGEYYPGYPARVVLSNNYHMVTAYGRTAAERRRSRVELWQSQGQLTIGMNDPMVEGKIVFVCSTSPAAAATWLEDRSLCGFAARLSEHPEVDAAPIQAFVSGWPAGQNSPQASLALVQGSPRSGEPRPIENGLALRLRIPFDSAELIDLRENGRRVPSSETDGFVTWRARGYTYVQIGIPPETARSTDLFVVTCRYDPRVQRGHWPTWRDVAE